METTRGFALDLIERRAGDLGELVALLEGLAQLFVEVAASVADLSFFLGDEIGSLGDL